MNRNEYIERRNSLINNAQVALDANNYEESNRLMTEVEQLDDEYETVATAQANLNALRGAAPASLSASSVEVIGGRVVESITPGAAPEDTYEYAFMNYVCRGVPIPDRFLNADATTTTTSASAVIPTTLAHEIIRELKSAGNIYSKVRKLNVQGGLEFPIISLLPTATWIGDNQHADSQSVTSNTKVSFSYYGIECKIAQSMLSNVTSIEEFNAMFVPLCVEAITIAVESAIISGNGSGKPLGITADTRVPSSNIITLSPTDVTSFEAWKKKVFGKMKKAYRNGVFIMAQSTFDGYIDGMVDSVGQPIGRVNYGIDGGETYRFGGKTVETVDDSLLAGYDAASTGDIFAIFVDLGQYAINTNQQLKAKQWEDNDTHEMKTSVTMICDGKLLDTNGVLLIKKGAASGS